MKTEQYVVTCAPEEVDQPYYSKFGGPDSDVYKFYGVRKIGTLMDYENEAYKYAWDFARMITNSPECSDLGRIFGVSRVNEVFNIPFDTALKMWQTWDELANVGDVCFVKNPDGTKVKVIVVERFYGKEGLMCRVLCADHLVRNIRPKELTKTDQHFDVDLIFEALNKEEDE